MKQKSLSIYASDHDKLVKHRNRLRKATKDKPLKTLADAMSDIIKKAGV